MALVRGMRSSAPVVSVPESSRLRRALSTKLFRREGIATGREGQGVERRLCAAGVTHLSLVPLQDNDTCEEWERHEALHEDVTKQDRVEERLFEEEIELKWEKGGSGLVFYTDAQYWQEENGGNGGLSLSCKLSTTGWGLGAQPAGTDKLGTALLVQLRIQAGILPSLFKPSLDQKTFRGSVQ